METEIFSSHWKPVMRCRSLDDPFFEEGNVACHLQYNKHVCIESAEVCPSKHMGDFACHQQHCNKIFTSISAYEIHYNSVHRNCCSTCQRRFPNQHLLDLHILEQHDQLFQVTALKKPMFKCLLENCATVSNSPDKRKQHLISAHKYPANFRFINLSKATKSKARDEDNPVSVKNEQMSLVEDMETEEPDKLHSVTTRKFQPRIPKNICFGRGVARGFSRKKNPWQPKIRNVSDTNVSIDDVELNDLSEALDTCQ